MQEEFLRNYLLARNTIVLNEEINSSTAAKVIVQIAAMDDSMEEDCIPMQERIITLYIIDCPGGSISAGLSIIDAMSHARAKIQVICCGMVASMAFVIAVCGTKGLRKTFRHTQFLMHQPLGGAQGQASDIMIQAKHIAKVKDLLCKMIAEHTGQTEKKVLQDSDRDFIVYAEDALRYGKLGIVDEMIEDEG